ncbi:MAG: 50S ribosomal protein L30 [Acidimicrobiia bacterium]|nr:50S ribosomal protein L30 [Acidimicrobiia bacterium]MDH5616118.1 50S ribosomal protein L30 [Acidimicrobiia bacterium]
MVEKIIDVTLVKSTIGEKPKTRATVRSLGLRRMHQTVEHRDTPDVRGMLARVAHLVRVEKKK